MLFFIFIYTEIKKQYILYIHIIYIDLSNVLSNTLRRFYQILGMMMTFLSFLPLLRNKTILVS